MQEEIHGARGTIWQRQVLPISLTLVAFLFLVVVVYGQILLLNHFTTTDISLKVRISDILIGLTVYLKTSIDFAIFIGNLMRTNTGWKNRISIELGTALGNGLGTMAVLVIWTIFRQVDWLLAIMIILAALVLFKLAQSGLEHATHTDREYPSAFKYGVKVIDIFLKHVNWFTAPLLKYILPDLNMNAKARTGFWSLFGFALIIPFVLGLDDFAGYVPLFSVVNILGFAIGAFGGHAILNMFLYLSPQRTIKTVSNPIISFIGSIAFIGLGAWGLFEATKLLLGVH
ncbi:hypothetical protein BH11PAT2_BH11PAT2_04510 [soil metagenome]